LKTCISLSPTPDLNDAANKLLAQLPKWEKDKCSITLLLLSSKIIESVLSMRKREKKDLKITAVL
jgi:hypothetical protein